MKKKAIVTYREIQTQTKQRFGFTPKTCWIAHLKSEHGLTRGVSPNRIHPDERKHPCPDHRRAELTSILVALGVIPNV